MRAVSVPFAGAGITVNAVVPGLIRKQAGTEQFLSADEWRDFARKVPVGTDWRAGRGRRRRGVSGLAEASYVTGQIIHVNGGLI